MKSVLVSSFDEPPRIANVVEPGQPHDASTTQVHVLASGVHNVVRSRAAGRHYSATAAHLPLNPGVDGVGRTSAGKVVYFSTMPNGSFSEIINLPTHSLVELNPSADPVHVAAYVNPTMSSWMALQRRTVNLPEKFKVLIMGVTSASGRIAVDVSRRLGAGNVIGVARNASAMQGLGLDDTIVLKENIDEIDFSPANGADVVLDYLYGKPTQHLFRTLQSDKEIQWVHIGSLAGKALEVPASELRSKNLTLRGAGRGSWSIAEMKKELPDIVKFVAEDLGKRDIRVEKFDDVSVIWNQAVTERLVLVP
ncbi:hypothetical protein EJ05DRAFT_391436 [Pseudovirgaria hyperparasitica]|uniref:Quinone oxidoreductase n=1 Tax=Pseudovirgaria hyperparasitica TaxID=470096 RepID=A0A6A6W6G2_9PEZI|nr:uncharacterized protein EJ05DRAFT_391436 [Pseudovirgaria hyperparasitica]KAF2757496.1 hypothetical protein EJ05DRAFT_391436 [Pseudovirgaria hyperparasitica]